MSDDLFDFGFTAVTEDDLQIVETSKNYVQELEEKLERVDKKALTIYNAIIPLLDNLRKNPEKEYILWPDRVKKIDAFQDKLLEILDGEDN